MIVDDSFGIYNQGYELTRICHDSGHILRVRIRRDSHEPQSWAVVEVLNPALTWTGLATAPPSTWHEHTPYRSRNPQPLVPIAVELVNRARAILTVDTTSPAPQHT
jgi:hypothetical protein